MIDYLDFFTYLKTTELGDFAQAIHRTMESAMRELSHGDLGRWCGAIEGMPEGTVSEIDLANDTITVAGDMDAAKRATLKQHLKELCPWRKGPFDLFGVHIDTEWRSDLKWARLKDHIDLQDERVLDVGCGNGYYLFRMLAAGARAAVGVDPTLLSVMQFHAVNRYARTHRAAVLPLGVDAVPADCGCFDTAFSMGLLYHRRDPKEHLKQLHGFVKPGGRVVLETLVLDTDKEEWLVPKERYAKMRNVWAIASPGLLQKWLTDCGFENVQVIDLTQTTSTEQRKTDWMTFESLADFLDPADNTQTIEGHPAPVRAILTAQKQ
ncbi:MAG: tRNA 5-methoxyuridine(34)/uridine 5-oxyacetic acid(34) synthase CmoB [Planctomycetales bacterium 4572_13]|nr:MAG: tRNA 5-methoxyuridine(34)/uridine 5-oxyacetic acid(34) synthase CmoB [Planctomycetales bacterium 4572_13]